VTASDQQKINALAEGLTKADNLQTADSQDSGHINLRTQDPNQDSAQDTISIDREGTLYHKEDIATPPTK
jgi:hypothetical protein